MILRKTAKKVCVTIIFCCFASMSWSQIINVEDKRKLFTDSIDWFERFSIGFDLNQNTQTVISLQASAHLEFAYKNKVLISITDGRFVKAGETNFINQGYQHLRYNSNLNDWLTYELFGQIQFNEQAFVKIRVLGGTGTRFRIIRKKKQQMYLGLSYMFEYDEEQNREIHRDSRLNSYLTFNVDPFESVSFAGTLYFQPLFNDFEDYRLSAALALIFRVSENLSVSTRYSQLYDSRRAEGAPNQIYSLSNLISYQF